MTYKIVALPGDGIGPEILNGSLELLEIISKKYNFTYNLKVMILEGAAIDTHGTPFLMKHSLPVKKQMRFY